MVTLRETPQLPKVIIMAVLLSLVSVLAACGAATAPVSPASPGAAQKPAATQKSDWDKMVETARSEGTVAVYAGTIPAPMRTAVQEAFKQKYGINVEFTVAGGNEIAQKFKAETNAGLHLVDLMQLGSTSLTNFIQPMHVTVPIEPLLVLPDVIDPGKWREGKLPFADAERHMFMATLLANNFIVTNNEAVKESDITSTPDLLNPKWKGKIVIQDPGLAGNGNDWFSFTIINILGAEKGEAFMRNLVKQEPVLSRDSRQMTEWVARNKYSIAIAPSMSMAVEFIRNGAPISFARVKEPRSLSPGSGVISTFKEVPHPNAAKLYINWLLSKEGSTVFAPAYGYPSTRVDVPTDSFIPAMIPAPGDVIPDPDYELKKGELLKLAAEIFAGLR